MCFQHVSAALSVKRITCIAQFVNLIFAFCANFSSFNRIVKNVQQSKAFIMQQNCKIYDKEYNVF